MRKHKTLRVSEVALRLGVERTTVIRWINEGYLSGAYKVGPATNSPFVVPLEEVVAFEEGLKEKQEPQ